MGLINFFLPGVGGLLGAASKNTLRAGMLTDYLQDKAVGKGISEVSSRTGLDEIQAAIGDVKSGGGALERLQSLIADVESRPLPEVEEYTPAKKSMRILNRVGAALYAAGGGDPRVVSERLRIQEEAKLARHEKSKAAREQEIQRRDLLTAQLGEIEAQAGLEAARLNVGALTDVSDKTFELAKAAAQNEANYAQMQLEINSRFQLEHQRHINNIAQLDHNASLTQEAQEALATQNMYNSLVARSEAAYGRSLDPGHQQSFLKYAQGDFANMNPVDYARVNFMMRVEQAHTDAEAQMEMIQAAVGLMGQTVPVLDQNGLVKINSWTNQPETTVISNPVQALQIMFPKVDPMEALKTVKGGVGVQDTMTSEAAQAWLTREHQRQQGLSGGVGVGTIAPPAQLPPQGETPIGWAAGTVRLGTQDAMQRQGLPARGGEGIRNDIRDHTAILAQIDKDVQAGIRPAEIMNEIVESHKSLSPEILAGILQHLMETGGWDGREDRDILDVIIRTGAPYYRD